MIMLTESHMKFFIAAYIGLIVALVSVVLGFIFGFAGIVLLAIIISLLFVLFVIAALQNEPLQML